MPICEQVEFNLRNCCGCLLLCSLLVFSEAPSCGCFNPFCVSQWQLCCEHLGFLSSSQNSLGLRDAFSQPAVACIFPCKYYYICHGPALPHSFVAVMQPGRVASFWFVLIHGTIALGGQSWPQLLIVHQSVLLELTPSPSFFYVLSKTLGVYNVGFVHNYA